MKFKEFLTSKGAIGAIVMGIFYAVAMLGIFLPGYAAIPGNLDRMPIAIVNEDTGEYGTGIAKQLKGSLPFEDIETDITNSSALKGLEKNELALVITIPQNFSDRLQQGKEKPAIDFTINEASATTVSSAISSVVAQINSQLSEQFSAQTAEKILMNVNVPEDQAAGLADQIEHAYEGNIVRINEMPDGMHNNMLPMFLTMAGYVGAMIGAMQLVSAFKAGKGKASRTRLFIYLQLTALLVAVFSSLAATGITYLVNQPDGMFFVSILAHQILNYMVCFNFTAILLFLFGEVGMILNIPIMLLQTLANGATIPREMMFAPYQWMSYISPMYYSVQGYFADLYGSVSASPYIWSMAAVGVIAMAVNIAIVAFVHKPVALEQLPDSREQVAGESLQ